MSMFEDTQDRRNCFSLLILSTTSQIENHFPPYDKLPNDPGAHRKEALP
jgi:hypothetical protein